MRFFDLLTGCLCSLVSVGCISTPPCELADIGCSLPAPFLYLLDDAGPGVQPVAPLYADSTNWNDYLVNDGTSLYDASGTACTGSESSFRACFHAGILQTVVTDRSSCGGLSAADSLGALVWNCRVIDGAATFVSVGFQPDMKLSDLIDTSAAAWRPFTVTVSGSSTPTATPWSNPIVIDNDGIAPAEAVSGTIYVMTADPATTATIDADKVGVIIAPGVQSSGMVTYSTNFGWFEGHIDLAGAASQALGFSTAKFSEGRGIRLERGSGTFTLSLTSAENIRLSDVRIGSSNAGQAVSITNPSQYNRFSEFYINNTTSGSGMNIQASNNVFMNVYIIAVFTGQGLQATVSNPTDNVFLNMTIAGVSGNLVQKSPDFNNFMGNIATANAGGFGFSLNSSMDHGWFNLATVHTTSNPFNAGPAASGAVSSGLIVIGNNGGSCNMLGGSYGVADTTCAGAHTLVTGADLTTSFVGLTTSDSENADGGGTGTAVSSGITDWTNFQTKERLWAADAADPMNAALRTTCTGASTCRIYDWSLSSSDNVLRGVNALPGGSDTFTHTFSGGSMPTFLRNATELLDDGAGDEDGLCESGEACLYTPNIGAYQGHGNLISAGAFSDGTVTGVTLYRYETNGR